MNYRSAFVAFTATLVALNSLAAQTPASARAPAQFPPDSIVLAIINQRVADKRTAGVVVGMLEADGRTRILSAGEAGAGQAPLDGNSVFEIGSITKVFTATVLAELVKEGRVSLDDPIEKFLPKSVHVPSRSGKPITLGSLAEQNSGLPEMPDNFSPRDSSNPYADYGVEQLYAFLTHYTLTRDPGTRYEYSNVGVGLLGHVLTLIAGRSYEDMERERVWKPLGMNNTAVTLTPYMKAHLALGHDSEGRVTANWDLDALAGAGAIRSTTIDMLKFASANLHSERGRIEGAMAFAQQERADAGSLRIGLNWMIDHVAGETIAWHNGGTGGYRTFLGLVPSRHMAVVVMMNSGNESADDIGMHLLAPANVPLAPKPAPRRQRTAIAVSRDVLAHYVGNYNLFAKDTVEISLTSSGLHIRQGGASADLFAESATDFFLKVVDAQITFVRDAQGAVTALVWHQNGRDEIAKRIP